MNRPVFLCSGTRTPIGRYQGALASVRSDDLAAHVLRSLLLQNRGIDPGTIDEVILGCTNQAGEDNRNIARMALLLAGLPDSVPGLTVNRLCASGLEAIACAARTIAIGEAELIIAGGVESMSRAPYVMAKAEKSFSREQQLEDSTLGWRFINPHMEALVGLDTLTQTAENLAAELSISRAAQDAYAARSQQRAARSREFHHAEISAIAVHAGRTQHIVQYDEHPRSDTTAEKLATLHTLQPGGTVTAGNCSGLNDGACALIVASESAVQRYSLQALARIVGTASAGLAPRIMGLGPIPATAKLLSRLHLTLQQCDHIELNEAFAAQVLACTRQWQLADDDERVNPNGGAIALGHPLGMSGARLALSAARSLQHHRQQRALVSLCVGVGQGLSMVLERS